MITKENSEKISKEKNVMIFGLNQGSNVVEDLKEVNKILQAIDLNIPNKKVNRFKASNSNK